MTTFSATDEERTGWVKEQGVCVCVCVCACVCVDVSACSRVRSCVLLLNSLGAWGAILGAMGEHLGLNFGCLGGVLGIILEALGVPWATFWRSGAPLGFIFGALGLLWRLWGFLGAPLAAQGAQSQIFPLFSLPFWAHFGSILEVKIDEKSDVILH